LVPARGEEIAFTVLSAFFLLLTVYCLTLPLGIGIANVDGSG